MPIVVVELGHALPEGWSIKHYPVFLRNGRIQWHSSLFYFGLFMHDTQSCSRKFNVWKLENWMESICN